MRRLDAAVFVAGAALMGLEIAGSRVLAPVFGTSIFVWGSLITTFLASLALGYWAGGLLADRRPEPALLASLLAGAGVVLWALFASPAWLLSLSASAPLPDRFRSLVASLALFAPPSVLMGMVTPFAVRLAARDLARVGSAAGRLSAVSTAGSILGTFAMAFFLIPTYATRPILYGLGASLVLASVLVPAPQAVWRSVRGLLLAGAGALLFLFAPSPLESPLPGGKVIFEKETAYHRLRVVDIGSRRCLFFNNANQGFVDPRPGHEPPPNYTDGLAMALAFRDRPLEEALSIGLGTGLVPSLVARRSPGTSMTTIEIDPEVVAVAGKYFGFVPRAKDRVLVGDGRRELLLDDRRYDAIFLDAYYADSVPFHLMTREFDELCREKLADDGILSINLVGILTGSKNVLFWAAVKTLRATFPCVYVFSGELGAGATEFRGNTIIVATRSRDRLDRGTIAERSRALSERWGRPAIASWGAALYDGEMRVNDVPILTDAYAPTDALQHLVKR